MLVEERAIKRSIYGSRQSLNTGHISNARSPNDVPATAHVDDTRDAT